MHRLVLLLALVGCPVPIRGPVSTELSPALAEVSDAGMVKNCSAVGDETAESRFFGDRGRKEARDELRVHARRAGATHIRFYGYDKRVEGTSSWQQEHAAYYQCATEVTEAQPKLMAGTCFFVTETGLAITNRHVVKDALSVKVTLRDGSEHDAAILRQLADADIALLQVRDVGATPYLVPGPDPIEIGQAVFTIGFPLSDVLGRDPKFVEGSISSLRAFEDDRLLQTNLLVHPGNSGGALVRRDGSLVGVVFAKADQLTFLKRTGSLGEGISFAVRFSKVGELLGKDAPTAAFKATSGQDAISRVLDATCQVVTNFE